MPETATLFAAPSQPLRTAIAIQASVYELELAVSLRDAYGFEVVLTAPSDPRRNPYKELEKAALAFCDKTGTMPQLDANHYAGPGRRLGPSELSADWAVRQIDLGVPVVVTDAGYVDGNIGDIRIALEHAAQLQQLVGAPVLASLAFPSVLLRHHSNEIVDIVGEAGMRVGLALGHAGDPLGPVYAVAGLLKLIKLGTVEPRRIDLSGIGALALGARSAAIGTSATLRHVYPIGAGGGSTSAFPSILVEKALCWRTQDRVMDAASQFLDHVFWLCGCTFCYGRPIHSSIRTAEDAIAHNYAVIAALADRVLTSPDPLTTWTETCRYAQSYAFEVAAESGPNWNPQDFLAAWVANQPSRVGF
jgi:hypothetical protein